MTSFRATPISNDITKIVRNHYNPPPARPYKYTKVWNRTNTNLLEERPSMLWERHYVRRQGNLHRGFHSLPWEAYHDIGGEVVLDPYDLVLKTLKNNLDDEVWSAPHKQFYDDKPKDRIKILGLPAIKHKEQEHFERPDLLPPETTEEKKPEEPKFLPPLTPLNGYRKVRERLAEDSNIIQYVRSGQSYEEYIRLQKVKELQEKGEDDSCQDNDMVLMSLKDLQMGLVRIAEDSSDSDEEEDIDDTMTPYQEQQMRVCPALKRMSRIRKSLALPADVDLDGFKSMLEPLEEGESSEDVNGMPSLNQLIKISSGITEKKERIRRDHLQYLDCLYKVIVSIHNMKGKDLKSKHPLSLDAVKNLQKLYNPPHLPPIQTDRGGESRLNYLAVCRFQTKLHQTFTMTAVESVTDGQVAPPRDRKVMIHDPHPSTISTATSPAQKMNFARRKSMKVPMEAVLHSIKKKKFGVAPGPIVETWEDLLNVQVATNQLMGLQLGTHANLVMKAMQWKRLGNHGSPSPASSSGHHRSSNHQEEPIPHYTQEKKETSAVKKLPIWQLVANEKYHNTTPTKKKKCRSTREVGNLAYNNRKKLEKMRSSLQQELDASLQKIEREKMVSFKMKYEVFDNLSPLFEEHLINMRRSITNMSRNVDILHVPPSKWYDELREKTYSITGQNDAEINAVLGKLSQFSTMDIKTVLQPKAKLCLLVMSLPAYSILTITMQKAIKYVLETILLGEMSMMVDWLKHRKFPLVLDLSYEESPPVFKPEEENNNDAEKDDNEKDEN